MSTPYWATSLPPLPVPHPIRREQVGANRPAHWHVESAHRSAGGLTTRLRATLVNVGTKLPIRGAVRRYSALEFSLCRGLRQLGPGAFLAQNRYGGSTAPQENRDMRIASIGRRAFPILLAALLAGACGEDRYGDCRLGKSAKCFAGTYPLDLYLSRCTTETAQTLPVNRRLTNH